MSRLEETLERLMTKRLSAELDKRGITDVGVAVPIRELESSTFSGLGALFRGGFAAMLRRRHERKRAKAKAKAKELVRRTGWMAKEIRALKKAKRPHGQLVAEFTRTANQAQVAAKEADAPTITKKEVLVATRPAIRKAAEQIADRVRRQVKRGRRKVPRPVTPRRIDVPFFAHPETEFSISGGGGVGSIGNRRFVQASFFPTYADQDWNFDFGDEVPTL